jgi:hypothetical protein
MILGSLITLDIGLYFVENIKSTETTFINNKFSKIKYFKLNNPKGKDIIFIGSSKTFYHISTNKFRENGIDIFNFGVSGAQFEDYPTLIRYTNSVNPKRVVISLSVDRLYNKLNISKYPTLDEIEYYYYIDKIKFLQSLKQWIVNRHLFLQYSEPIFYKVKSIYEKFESPMELDNETLNSKKSFKDKSINYSKLVNCKVFDVKQESDTRTTLKCTNGDGVLLGSNLQNNNINTKELKKFNQQSIKFLHKLIANIDKEEIEVLIIFEPTLHNTFSYNLNDIKKQFKDIKILDLTNLKIQDSFWLNNSHLNYQGREQYSQYLSDILK